MKTTVEYLTAAKAASGLESDSGLSKHIGISRAAMSQYLSGVRVMDDYTALRVAQILGVDPLEVIAAANHERERTAERREAWENLWNATTRIGRAASLAVLALGFLISAETIGSDVRNEQALSDAVTHQVADSDGVVPLGGII
ncbi:helix-turn-helix domain-containing protein [Chitinimonas lacunae]|uniref:Helix-turn-helix domain-containing protein n=1 Tax=Chitinimonas lacunae TaxID=1963018 RepID=A0ABV8MK17_9NEIS